MPSFTYMARDREGLLKTGALEAVNEEEVLTALQSRGLIVTSLVRRDGRMTQAVKSRMTRRFHGRVTTDDKVLFCQQLATLLNAGVPLLRSLEVISFQIDSRPLHHAVERIRQDLEGGSSFRDAVARHPRLFTKFWINLVETGEASGHLGQSLEQLARYLESVRDLQTKAITAMTYPLVLIVAAVGALAFFMLKIIPIFAGVFASMKIELPLLTRIVLAVSAATQHYFFLMILAAVALGYAAKVFVATTHGRWIVDVLILKLPVFNQLVITLQLAQFARGLSTLLESGVPILFALEIVASSAMNKVYEKAIEELRELVREGRTMAEPMAKTGLFPPMMVQMVQIGEEIGELDQMLDRVAKYYEGRVSTFIERMTSLFEPFAICFMAVIIGTIVIAIFMPIFSMAGGFHG